MEFYFHLHEHQNKEQFIQTIKKRISDASDLKAFCMGVLPSIIRKFDGKILNARLINGIRNSLPRKEFIAYRNPFIKREIVITVYKDQFKNDYELVDITLVVNDDNRIDAKQTIANIPLAFLDGRIALYLEAISEYDAMMEKAIKLEQAINEFNAGANSCFRSNIQLPSLNS